MFESFEKYLIYLGIRSNEYTYDLKELFDNLDYFKECFNRRLSCYKALLFLCDYLNEKQNKNETMD